MKRDPREIAPDAEPPLDRTEQRTLALSRRELLSSLLAAGALAPLLSLIGESALAHRALAAGPDPLNLQTLKGLVAFFVPGMDEFSVEQGEQDRQPGGVEGLVGEGLLGALDFILPGVSDVAVGLLNDTAANFAPSGPFASNFANLTFAQKGQVLAGLEGTSGLEALFGLLPILIGFLAYSEFSVFDPVNRTIGNRRPVGWIISNYSGVSDGRNEFLGYFKNRRMADA